jgi:hypothetical protein
MISTPRSETDRAGNPRHENAGDGRSRVSRHSFEARPDRRQVEIAAGDVRVRASDFHREAAL